MLPAGSAVAPGSSNLKIVRSMPVETWLVTEALLLVSSASKIALPGSTVTELVSGPTESGATRVTVKDSMDSGAMLGLVQVRTPPLSEHEKSAPPTLANSS
ncbi:MAG: hypothetical protein BWY91_01817 [bacterium ADurb.BinA028]|nr:MAG: hypothetical protein BWY91_01817 [bacterium ADurb.BinA028]